MLHIGTYQTLEVKRLTDIGAVLRDEDGEEVLLPGKYVPEAALPGYMMEVFLYKDHEERPVATTRKPLITLHTAAILKVKQTSQVGAWMDWGLEKDLLVPFREQKGPMLPGEEHLVWLYLDERSERLAASAHLQRFLRNDTLTVEEGEAVDLVVWNQTDLGFNVVVNNRHIGLVYANEIFSPIQTGDRLTGFVKQIREDNKLDIALQEQGFRNIEPNAEKLLHMLKDADGFLPFTDKSAPEDIVQHFEMSKKTFKKALGSLYRQRLVRLEADGIYLVS